MEEACKRMDVRFVVIDKNQDDAPYGLNLQQFSDGSIFMTSGHASLQKLLGEIVGEDRVFITGGPILAHSVLRSGGIRCLLLVLPTYALELIS